MNRAALLDAFAQTKEDRLLLARALDKGEAAARKQILTHTPFLNEREARLMEALPARWDGCPNHLFFGGYPDAQRKVLFFLPDGLGADALTGEDSPIAVLQTGLPPGAALTHRDFLGALMGMGVTRETVGDILTDGDRCTLFLLREVAPFLCSSLETVGSYQVALRPAGFGDLRIPPPQVRLIRDTVATPRLDAVAASGFSLSRGRSAALIGAGKVSLNHQVCVKPDRLVLPGDTVSARGFGKFRVLEAGGRSRKGRVFLVLEKYV